jgi:hypothetical protein
VITYISISELSKKVLLELLHWLVHVFLKMITLYLAHKSLDKVILKMISKKEEHAMNCTLYRLDVSLVDMPSIKCPYSCEISFRESKHFTSRHDLKEELKNNN